MQNELEINTSSACLIMTIMRRFCPLSRCGQLPVPFPQLPVRPSTDTRADPAPRPRPTDSPQRQPTSPTLSTDSPPTLSNPHHALNPIPHHSHYQQPEPEPMANIQSTAQAPRPHRLMHHAPCFHSQYRPSFGSIDPQCPRHHYRLHGGARCNRSARGASTQTTG